MHYTQKIKKSDSSISAAGSRRKFFEQGSVFSLGALAAVALGRASPLGRRLPRHPARTMLPF